MNSPNRRLGRGLGSLIAGGGQGASVLEEKPLPEVIEGTDVQESDLVFDNGESEIPNFSNESNKLQELPIEQVVPNPHQPRKVIDPQAVTELAASIESEGLLQPIVVRPAEHGYELIAGERRWRAHQHLESIQSFLCLAVVQYCGESTCRKCCLTKAGINKKKK